MSRAEAQVLLARLLAVIDDLRDLSSDAPAHVAMDRGRHIEAIAEAAADLRRTYGVSV